MEKIGKIITFLWIVLFVLLLIFKWDAAIKLSLNEWGDFLAGATAPIAFLWLIIGYMLQREELQRNTEALKEQQAELSRQHKALLEQNSVMEKYVKSMDRLSSTIENEAHNIIRYGS